MTTRALTAPAAAPKNVQARGTVGILNIARWTGVAFFAFAALIAVGATLVGLAHGETYTALGGLLGLVFTIIFGALFYAVIGWYVDTLALLTQIAQNTASR